MVTDCETEKTKTAAIDQGKSGEMLVYRVNKTGQTIRIRKTRTKKKASGVLKNVMEDQKGCKKNTIRAEEGQITAAQKKQHEEEEENIGVRPAWREAREQK